MTLETVQFFIDRFGYIALFVGAFLDGFHVVLLGGFLIALNYLAPIPTFISLLLGNITSDIAWYSLGLYGGTRAVDWVSKYYSKLPKYLDKMKKLLENHPGKIIIAVKLTLGLSLATVIAAGLSKMNFKKFLAYDLIGSVGIIAEMLLLGYLFGESYERLRIYFEALGKAAVILAIIAIIGVSIWNKRRNG